MNNAALENFTVLPRTCAAASETRSFIGGATHTDTAGLVSVTLWSPIVTDDLTAGGGGAAPTLTVTVAGLEVPSKLDASTVNES